MFYTTHSITLCRTTEISRKDAVLRGAAEDSHPLRQNINDVHIAASSNNPGCRFLFPGREFLVPARPVREQMVQGVIPPFIGAMAGAGHAVLMSGYAL